MKIAVDTNVLAYAEGVNGNELRQKAWSVIDRIRSETPMVPAQVLGELFNVLDRKAKFTRSSARNAILDWNDIFTVIDTTSDILLKAADLSAEHNLQIWDAVIVCAASQAGCRLLLSEDMQDGFMWGGVTVVNPFAAKPHPLVAALFK